MSTPKSSNTDGRRQSEDMCLKNCSLCASEMSPSSSSDFPPLSPWIQEWMEVSLVDFYESGRKYTCDGCLVQTVKKLNANKGLKRRLRSCSKNSVQLIAKEIHKINLRIIQTQERKTHFTPKPRVTLGSKSKFIATSTTSHIITPAKIHEFTRADSPMVVTTRVMISSKIEDDIRPLQPRIATLMALKEKIYSKSQKSWSSESLSFDKKSPTKVTSTDSSESIQRGIELSVGSALNEGMVGDLERAKHVQLLEILRDENKLSTLDSERFRKALPTQVQDELLTEIFAGKVQTSVSLTYASSSTSIANVPSTYRESEGVGEGRIASNRGAFIKTISQLPGSSALKDETSRSSTLSHPSESIETSDTEAGAETTDTDEPLFMCGDCGSIIPNYRPEIPLKYLHTCDEMNF